MWVVRDKDRTLWLTLLNEPERNEDGECWFLSFDGFSSKEYIELDNSLFPSLKWEDEPIDVEIDTRQSLITRMEILHTNYYQESNKFFDENPGKGFMSFDEYALKNWDNVDMDYFKTIG